MDNANILINDFWKNTNKKCIWKMFVRINDKNWIEHIDKVIESIQQYLLVASK